MSTDITLDINYIQNKIQNILDKNHTVDAKKRIKRYPSDSNPERLNFSCPCCGDSDSNANKKRGNIYSVNAMYKCYNCGAYMSFTKLCDTFGEQIDMENRIKIYNYIDNNLKYTKTDNSFVVNSLERLIPIEDFVEYFNNKINSWLIDIMPVQKNSHVYQYLKYDRMVPNFEEDIYQGTYRVVRDGVIKFSCKVLINMNMSNGMLLGIQLRNLEKEKEKRFFKIIEFDELYNYMHPNDPLDDIESISYNKLSHFYNILNVNFEKPVTIFEGFLDSKFCDNAIGMVGLNSSRELLNFLLESDDDLQLRFFYDKDAPGIKMTTELLNKGYQVFLWNKLFEKIIKKSIDKNEAKKRLSNIKDLNDLAINAKDQFIYNKLKLDNYFSKDKYDIIYIDKLIYNKELKKYEIKK
ncbi:hypothetical protein M0Q50_01345 [bacterium]|jgi:transcription elongation factor Elf1|nr:hypothetical protein [bacterium]